MLHALSLLLMAAVMHDEEQQQNHQLIIQQVVAATAAILCLYQVKQRIRRRTYQVYRRAIIPYSRSAWQFLYDSCRRRNDDISMLTVCGVDIATFHFILEAIQPFMNRSRSGRPRILPPHAELALTLHYLNGTIQEKHLCQIFGITLSTVNRTIHRVLDALNNVLPMLDDAKIKWPTPVSA